MPAKKRINPILTGPIGSINTPMLAQQKAADKMFQKAKAKAKAKAKPKPKRKYPMPGKKRLKKNIKVKPKKPTKNTKRKPKTNDEIAVKLLMQMCKKLSTVCTVCDKLQSASGSPHKKKKKKKKKSKKEQTQHGLPLFGPTPGQSREGKVLRKQSKYFGKLTKDIAPHLAF